MSHPHPDQQAAYEVAYRAAAFYAGRAGYPDPTRPVDSEAEIRAAIAALPSRIGPSALTYTVTALCSIAATAVRRVAEHHRAAAGLPASAELVISPQQLDPATGQLTEPDMTRPAAAAARLIAAAHAGGDTLAALLLVELRTRTPLFMACVLNELAQAAGYLMAARAAHVSREVAAGN